MKPSPTRKIFLLAVWLLLLAATVRAQTGAQSKIDSVKAKIPANEQTEKFKKNDTAYAQLKAQKTVEQNKKDSSDLKLTQCDFEKNANAMVLFDVAKMAFGNNGIIMERHKRIKIFNDNAKNQANIRIEYNNKFGVERVLAVVAETINFNNGKIERTKLDSTLIYNVHTDKEKDAIIFSMPKVKAGSVIEYGYIWMRAASRNFPDWDFQCELPTRYSRLDLLLNPNLRFSILTNTNLPFTKDTIAYNGYGHIWIMENVPSAKQEPFMRSAGDGLQKISLLLKEVTDYTGVHHIADSWGLLAQQIAEDKRYYKPFDQNIGDDLVSKAKKLKTEDERIAYIFNEVKTQMKWNGEKSWLSKDGIKSAWKKKTGNWGEINMILCNFLKQCGIKASPMLVSTRDNGMLYNNFPNIFQVNKLVVYIPVDTARYYVLDASNRYNLYNEIPFELLNTTGLAFDKEKKSSTLLEMGKELPVQQRISIDAEIKPDGTMNGTADINNYSYNRSAYLELYKTLDEKKYKEYLTDNDNNLQISTLKIENADVDSLPLILNINFKLDLSATDDKYIYFTPNLFTPLHNNPFISQNRTTDIDFGYKNNINIFGRYKLPDGYKVDFLPKSGTIITPGKTITFKRMLGQTDDGYLSVHYTISYEKSIYSKAEYADMYIFFKKMYEMLNEQIVLKKS